MRHSGQAMWGRPWIAGIALALGCGFVVAPAPGVWAAEGARAQNAGGNLGLDELLRLPESFDAGGQSVGGAAAPEWRARFREARSAVDEARRALEAVHDELGELAGDTSQYQVAAPGISADPENTPMSYSLRQEIRRKREQLEARQRELRALEVEANLVGVPKGWQQEPIRGE